MLDHLLMRFAVQSGKLKFEETPTGYRMYASAMGMKITLSSVTKKAFEEIMKKAVNGDISPGQPAEAGPVVEQPPVRRRPKLEIVK